MPTIAAWYNAANNSESCLQLVSKRITQWHTPLCMHSLSSW